MRKSPCSTFAAVVLRSATPIPPIEHSTATRGHSGLFFATGRHVASVSQSYQANSHNPSLQPTFPFHNTTLPVSPTPPAPANKKVTFHSVLSVPLVHAVLFRPVHLPHDAPVPPSSPFLSFPQSPLNPFAEEFIPFAISNSQDFDTTNDGDDLDFVGDPSLADHQAQGRNPYLGEFLWYKFRQSDDYARPPNPCECHGFPIGFCPKVKLYHVERIARDLPETGLVPNMDDLQEPLRYPSFPVDVWE